MLWLCAYTPILTHTTPSPGGQSATQSSAPSGPLEKTVVRSFQHPQLRLVTILWTLGMLLAMRRVFLGDVLKDSALVSSQGLHCCGHWPGGVSQLEPQVG